MLRMTSDAQTFRTNVKTWPKDISTATTRTLVPANSFWLARSSSSDFDMTTPLPQRGLGDMPPLSSMNDISNHRFRYTDEAGDMRPRYSLLRHGPNRPNIRFGNT